MTTATEQHTGTDADDADDADDAAAASHAKPPAGGHAEPPTAGCVRRPFELGRLPAVPSHS